MTLLLTSCFVKFSGFLGEAVGEISETIIHFFFGWSHDFNIKLVSKELYHFGEIARIFPQIRGHSNIFLLCNSIGRLFAIKMIKSVKSIFFFIVKINIGLVKTSYFYKWNEFHCRIFNFHEIFLLQVYVR